MDNIDSPKMGNRLRIDSLNTNGSSNTKQFEKTDSIYKRVLLGGKMSSNSNSRSRNSSIDSKGKGVETDSDISPNPPARVSRFSAKKN